MNITTVLQAIAALAALTSQLAPMAAELKAAAESGDEERLKAFLAKLQAVNDQLGAL